MNYHLLEGSNLHQLSSKLYCPSILFNYDEWEKDILIESFSPTLLDSTLSHERPLRHRDFIGIIAEIDGLRLAYSVVNTEEIKIYHSIRWTIFYIAMFFTSAFFFSFVVFMVLRRKKVFDDGYIRVSANASSEHLGWCLIYVSCFSEYYQCDIRIQMINNEPSKIIIIYLWRRNYWSPIVKLLFHSLFLLLQLNKNSSLFDVLLDRPFYHYVLYLQLIKYPLRLYFSFISISIESVDHLCFCLSRYSIF